jgi:hypothetical protein
MRDSLFWIVAVGPEKMAILGFCAIAGTAVLSRTRIKNDRIGMVKNVIEILPIRNLI